MAEQLDRYELERRIEKLEFWLDEKSKYIERLEKENEELKQKLGITDDEND